MGRRLNKRRLAILRQAARTRTAAHAPHTARALCAHFVWRFRVSIVVITAISIGRIGAAAAYLPTAGYRYQQLEQGEWLQPLLPPVVPVGPVVPVLPLALALLVPLVPLLALALLVPSSLLVAALVLQPQVLEPPLVPQQLPLPLQLPLQRQRQPVPAG